MAEMTLPPPTDNLNALTPREARIRRAGEFLRWGAIVNALAVVLIILVAAIGASGDSGLEDSLAEALLFQYSGGTDRALIAVVLLILANVCALLVVMIGVLAQEIWSLALLIIVLAANSLMFVLLGFIPAVMAFLALLMAGGVVASDINAFRLNPVMLKELRERMRGARAFVVITIYLGLMSGFAILLYLLERGVVQNSGSAVTGELGRVLFRGIVGIELLLIVFIAPAFTAGAVSNERERKTYDLLQITLLPRPSFIIGKLESALSYIFLLLLAAIPLQSIAFLFGGVSELELALAFVILAVTSIALGTVGLYFSTTVDRTLSASVRAYTVAFSVTLGIPIAMAFFVNIFNNALIGTGTNATDNPVVESIFIYLGAVAVSLNPVTTAISSQRLLIDQQEIGFWTATLSSDGSTIPMISPWISFSLLYLVISSIMIVLAVRRMRDIQE